MKHSIQHGAMALTLVTLWFAAGVDAQESESQKIEAAIRNAAREFTEAFDRGDAEALANHFTSDGVYVNEDGKRFEGRDAIRQEYQMLFDDVSDLRLKLEIDSIQMVNATTVVEEGRVALMPQPPGANRVMSQYTAVHTLQDGKWLMANVRDTRIELPPDFGRLEDLDWLAGTWAAEEQDANVDVKASWIENDHFLARTHSVTESGKVTATGFQIIGVDPTTGQITSWNFNSDGGHAVGFWAPHDQGWLVESVGATGDGAQTTAINILSRIDDDTLVWKSANRTAGDTTLPDTQEVTLKRQ